MSEMGSREPKVGDVASDERMITEAHGDLLQSDAEALVNAVNTVGGSADIKSGLVDLVRVCRSLRIASIAVPPLGCGNGGLA